MKASLGEISLSHSQVIEQLLEIGATVRTGVKNLGDTDHENAEAVALSMISMEKPPALQLLNGAVQYEWKMPAGDCVYTLRMLFLPNENLKGGKLKVDLLHRDIIGEEGAKPLFLLDALKYALGNAAIRSGKIKEANKMLSWEAMEFAEQVFRKDREFISYDDVRVNRKTVFHSYIVEKTRLDIVKRSTFNGATEWVCINGMRIDGETSAKIIEMRNQFWGRQEHIWNS
jgi:hypothetical protein